LIESLLAGVVWAAGASALGILVVQMKLPANAGLGPVSMAAAFATLVTASAVLGLAFGGLFHGIAILSGGSGDVSRSMQGVAHLAALLPLCAIILWFSNPLLWIVPTVWGTWIAVSAIEKLHDADSGQAWMVAGVIGLAAAGSQVLFRDTVASAHFDLENRLTIYAVDPNAASYASESSKSLQAPVRAGGTTRPNMPSNPMAVGPSRNGPLGANPGGADSSLGMIRQPGQSTRLAGDPNLALPTLPANIPNDPAQLQQMGMGLYQGLQQQLKSNPQALDGLPEDQRAMVQKYLSIAERAAAGDTSVVQELDPEQIRKDSQKMTEYANQAGR
jgi:hypothetical protein